MLRALATPHRTPYPATPRFGYTELNMHTGQITICPKERPGEVTVIGHQKQTYSLQVKPGEDDDWRNNMLDKEKIIATTLNKIPETVTPQQAEGNMKTYGVQEPILDALFQASRFLNIVDAKLDEKLNSNGKSFNQTYFGLFFNNLVKSNGGFNHLIETLESYFASQNQHIFENNTPIQGLRVEFVADDYKKEFPLADQPDYIAPKPFEPGGVVFHHYLGNGSKKHHPPHHGHYVYIQPGQKIVIQLSHSSGNGTMVCPHPSAITGS